MTDEEMEILIEKKIDGKIDQVLESLAERIDEIWVYDPVDGYELRKTLKKIVAAIREGVL